MTLSVLGFAAASARAPLAPVPRLASVTAEHGSDGGGLVRSNAPHAPAAGIDDLNRATADPGSDEAWDRIDALLGQLRQLTLGGAETSATASATTTAQAISAYAQNADAADHSP
jgi:hypothetical protein